MELHKLREVNFVEASLEGNAILESSPLAIWGTLDGRPAVLTADRWTSPAAGAKR